MPEQRISSDRQHALTAFEYHSAIRKRDIAVHTVAERARVLVNRWTGCDSFIGGSLAMGLHIETSDIDLIVPVPECDFARITSMLHDHCQFRGKREATATTVRHLFCIRIGEIHVDFNLMIPEDADLIRESLDRANRTLTQEERIELVWNKYLLSGAEDRGKYEDYKLDVYRRFFPDFVWKTEPEIRSELRSTKKVGTNDLTDLPPQYYSFDS